MCEYTTSSSWKLEASVSLCVVIQIVTLALSTGICFPWSTGSSILLGNPLSLLPKLLSSLPVASHCLPLIGSPGNERRAGWRPRLAYCPGASPVGWSQAGSAEGLSRGSLIQLLGRLTAPSWSFKGDFTAVIIFKSQLFAKGVMNGFWKSVLSLCNLGPGF